MSVQTSGFLVESQQEGISPYQKGDVRDAELEGVDGVSVFPVEWPGDGLVQVLDGDLNLFGNVSHYGVNDFALVVPLIALDDVFGRHSALGQIDVTLLLVDSEDDNDLVPSDADKLLDTPDTSSGQLGEQDHAIAGGLLDRFGAVHRRIDKHVVVFEELDVCSHVGDLVACMSAKFEEDDKDAVACLGRGPTCLTFTMTKLSTSGYFSSGHNVRRPST